MLHPEPLATVLERVLSGPEIGRNTDLARIWEVWDETVGEHLRMHAQPEAIRGNLLLVKVTSAAYAQDLHFLRPKIMDRLNRALGKTLLREIRIQVGLVHSP